VSRSKAPADELAAGLQQTVRGPQWGKRKLKQDE
jgi:hypothetical protein